MNGSNTHSRPLKLSEDKEDRLWHWRELEKARGAKRTAGKIARMRETDWASHSLQTADKRREQERAYNRQRVCVAITILGNRESDLSLSCLGHHIKTLGDVRWSSKEALLP